MAWRVAPWLDRRLARTLVYSIITNRFPCEVEIVDNSDSFSSEGSCRGRVRLLWDTRYKLTVAAVVALTRPIQNLSLATSGTRAKLGVHLTGSPITSTVSLNPVADT
jgi:hypothetical protein